MSLKPFLACIQCGKTYQADENIYLCGVCGSLLEVRLEGLEELAGRVGRDVWGGRDRTMWRYREVLPNFSHVISLREGGTPLYEAAAAARWAGVRKLFVKYEGLNPTGSFKDRGMSVGVSKAVQLRKKIVVCASTGNTASSMAAYAAAAGLKAVVVVPRSGVAVGKLFQTILHGAEVAEVSEGFDKALQAVINTPMGADTYILNSVNPWRIEGQKTAAYELWDDLRDLDIYLSIPVGNCGNISAYWKGFKELQTLGLTDSLPRLVAVQAEGASPFVDMVLSGSDTLKPMEKPSTIASAIRIGRPVNWRKALRAVKESEGLAEKVGDSLILEAQKVLASLVGVGVEPASAASLAGVKKLVEKGVIDRDATVVCVATGHALKDPNPEILTHQMRQPSRSIEDVLKSL